MKAAGARWSKGKRLSNDMQAAEKWYLDLRLEVRNKGGHSSQPVPDNAIYHLAGALTRISQFGFPLKTNEVTRAYFAGMAKLRYDRHQGRSGKGGGWRSGSDEAGGADVAGLELDAAHHVRGDSAGRRACAQRAAATRRGQCQLPRAAGRFARVRARHAEESHRRRSGQVSITNQEANSPGSPLRPDIMRAMSRLTDTMWPGVVVLPTMSTGANRWPGLARGGNSDLRGAGVLR